MWISLYLVIAIICVVILIVIAALGGFVGGDMGIDLGHDVDLGMDHFDAGYGDFGGAGISPLSLPLILVFGASFGSFGALLELFGMNPLITPILAALISVGVAALVYVVMVKIFVKSQGTTSVSLPMLIGKEALVTIRVQPDSEGQIAVNTEERGRVPIPAVSEVDIPTGTTVKIVGTVGHMVKVEKMKKEG
ncbi:MAG: NfeD family protein [Candidatus Thermoplasmatota archaeon]